LPRHDLGVKWIALILCALAWAGPASAGSIATYRAAPAADVSLPFWCDWSYDWEERCWRDFSDRLPIGGDVDKVWRAALRFPLASVPDGAAVVEATLFLSFDGVCLGPRMTATRCPARTYTLDVLPIYSDDWFHEREVDAGPAVASGSFATVTSQRLPFDVTDQVIEWLEHGAPNNGFLLKLADSEEEYGVGGPKLPSVEFANSALRPALEVRYVP
jgi:hypothetical protein